MADPLGEEDQRSYHGRVASEGHPAGHTAIVAALQAGERPQEQEVLRVLSSPGCPSQIVEELAHCRWVLSSRRVLGLLLRHPACPRPFAWQALPRIGWHDLLLVCRDSRTAPPILRQAERKLLEKVPSLTRGERTALARRAPRGVLATLLGDGDPDCIAALLGNPLFTEAEAVRLVHRNRNPECLLVLLRHPRWGSAAAVRAALVRVRHLPLGVALGLVPVLGRRELSSLAAAEDVREPLRQAAEALLSLRQGHAHQEGSSSEHGHGSHGRSTQA